MANRPSVMVGTSAEISHIGKLLNIPTIVVNEDDAAAVPLFSKLSYPWADCILSPMVCYNEKWESKSIKYYGYHELAYLHPDHFSPDPKIARKYTDIDEPYVIIRFAKLTAHHDRGIKGIDSQIAQKIVNVLLPHWKVYITSERLLETQFEQYRLQINPLDMHHVMAFARLYIGDSQTMAAEAGVMGVPFIRYNDFVGRIGYLNELENKYKLGFGIKTNDIDGLIRTITRVMLQDNLHEEWRLKREKMLSEKIDAARFMTWFIEDYPESILTLRKNPDFQFTFR